MGEQIVGRAPSRGRQVGLDMVRSLGLVALALLVWMWFSHPRTPDPVREVDWWPVAASASKAAPYEVLAPPPGLGWPATTARIEPQPDGTIVWRVGFLTPEQDYAALLQRGAFPEQAAGAAQEWIAAETRNAVPGDAVTLGGREWMRMEGDPTPDERRALVRTEAGTVSIVTGSASWSELEQLAQSVRPAG